MQNKPSQTWTENKLWEKKESVKKTKQNKTKKKRELKMKILRSFSQPQNEPTHFEERVNYTVWRICCLEDEEVKFTVGHGPNGLLRI